MEPRPRRRTGARIVALALAAVIAASCGSTTTPGSTPTSTTAPAGPPAAAPTPATAAVSLAETGSTLLYPLFSEWGSAYQQQFPHVTISTADGGSGAGIAQVAAGAVDIGASDAYLSEGDVKEHPGLVNIALAISAQQISYNLPGLTGNLKLDGPVLAGMYRGDIRVWNDPRIAALNPGVTLPATTVVPLHRSDGSGDTFAFTQYLSKQDPDGWGRGPGFGTTVDFPAVAATVGENGNGAMVTGCAANPGCVAYLSTSFGDEARAAGLGEAQLGNAEGSFLLPGDAAVRTAAAGFADKTPDDQTISLIDGPAPDGYPIISYEYAIVDTGQRDADTAQTLRAFLHWAVTAGNAPQYLDKAHLHPLPDAVAKQSIAQIAKISAG